MKLIRKLLIVLTEIFFSTTGCNDSDSPFAVTPDNLAPTVGCSENYRSTDMQGTASLTFKIQRDSSIQSISVYRNSFSPNCW